MTILMIWLRVELRRRWRPLLVVALLVALTTGTVLASAAGARRGASSVDRLVAVTLPATAQVVPNQSGFDWDAVRDLPQVEAVTTFPAYTGLAIEGVNDDSLTPFVSADGAGMHTIERAVVLEGRRADRARADEAVVTQRFLQSSGRQVGDTLRLHLTTPAQAEANLAAQDIGEPAGPVVPLRIVGVVRSLWYGDEVGGRGRVIPSAGLLAAYRANFLGASDEVPLNGLVRLRDGARDLPAFRADLARVSGRSDIDVRDRSEIVDRAREVVRFENGGLLAFAIAALLAGGVMVGQAIMRDTASTLGELRTLKALGVTRRQGTAAAVIGPLLSTVVGIGLGGLAAVAVSRWMPFGAANAYEPQPGTSIDLPVLIGGGAIALLAILGAVAGVAWRGLTRNDRVTDPRRSVVARSAVRWGLPVPVAVGMSFALEPETGRDTLPVRATLLGAITGVLGVIAASTVASGVNDASTHPERFGQSYQLVVVFGTGGRDFAPSESVLEALAADPDVFAVTDLRVSSGTSKATTVVTHTYDPVGTPVPLVLTQGVEPVGDDDIVLAPTTARELDAEVGSIVPLRGDRASRDLRVTGIGFGVQSSTSSYDRGAWITPRRYDQLFTGFSEHSGLLTIRDDTDPGTVIPRLGRVAATAAGGRELIIFPPFTPAQFGEIRNIERLPLLLGVFLACLAASALGHALVTAVRRRRRDLAVFRALGMTSNQLRSIMLVQGTTVAGFGLVFGIPLGVAVGRTLWRVAADSAPLLYRPPSATIAIVLVPPAALLVACLLAMWPSRRAARLEVADVLRGEGESRSTLAGS